MPLRAIWRASARVWAGFGGSATPAGIGLIPRSANSGGFVRVTIVAPSNERRGTRPLSVSEREADAFERAAPLRLSARSDQSGAEVEFGNCSVLGAASALS